jgi:hypothetical protein
MDKEQNKMKTLKQFWKESAIKVQRHEKQSFTIWLDECLQWSVKEWLTQKRQAHGNKCEGTEMLDELLEDLKQ